MAEKALSIITSVLNDHDNLWITRDSLLAHPLSRKLEWVIQDGSPSAATENLLVSDLDIKYENVNDSGIYDAWNKALLRTTGKWIIFIGAGDTLSNDLTSHVLSMLDDRKALYYGKIENIKKYQRKIDFRKWDSFRPKFPHHQSIIHNHRIFVNASYDLTYKIMADQKFNYEYYTEDDCEFLDIFIASVLPGGVSSRGREQYVIECRKFCAELGLVQTSHSLRNYLFLINSHLKRLIRNVWQILF